MNTITIFTPSYNRANTLTRLYTSLKQQTCKDFVWMVIDDGSKDNTSTMVNKWTKNEKSFEIIYIKKENGGLHTGYNTAIKHAQTELMYCVDSDDYLPNNAVEIILDYWRKNGSEKYAGIVALDFDCKTNKILGDKLPNQKSINLIDLAIGKYKLRNGDRANIIRTNLYKEVAPVPTFKNEKNFNPHWLHLKISLNYDFLILNENVKYVDYQQDGMTNSIFKQYYNSPNSFIEIRKLNLSFNNISFKFKFKTCIHYVSSCIIAKRYKDILAPTNRTVAILAIPFGMILSVITKIKGK